MKDCLIVFAKEPQIGKVKTRLQEFLSETSCVQLYKAFLKDTLDLARALRCCKVLAYDSSAPEPEYLERIAGDFIFYRQIGRGLGSRMYNAFKSAKMRGCNKAVIIGSDSPNLPIKYVKEAYVRLDKADIVLGPSRDGGYYLIGLKEPCREIFRGIKWSSKTVFEDTVRKAGKIGKKIVILKEWYDVDDLIGLTTLKKDLIRNKKAALWTIKELRT
jgi:rSAM/selenodomain-associated transferase 1